MPCARVVLLEMCAVRWIARLWRYGVWRYGATAAMTSLLFTLEVPHAGCFCGAGGVELKLELELDQEEKPGQNTQNRPGEHNVGIIDKSENVAIMPRKGQ